MEKKVKSKKLKGPAKKLTYIDGKTYNNNIANIISNMLLTTENTDTHKEEIDLLNMFREKWFISENIDLQISAERFKQKIHKLND